MIDAILSRTERFLWDPQLAEAKGPVRFLVNLLRYPYALIRDVLTHQGQLTMRAMSLVYTTLLAVVPLLAFSFSILKAFNVHKGIEPLLFHFLQPLGEKGTELTDRVIMFVDNVSGGLLGSVGLLFLLYTVISMVQKVEESFNYVWQVERPRSFGRRFSEYLSVILIGPVLMVFAIGFTATIRSTTLVEKLSNIEPFGTTIVLVGNIAPYVLVIFVFTFLYTFMPNTRVRIQSALVGGITAGIAWAATGAVFASFVVASTRYVAIYSAFGIVLLALIWLYLNWLILLLGSQIAFYHQHPEYLRTGHRSVQLQNAIKEHLGLMVMFLIGRDYRNPGSRWTLNELASHLNTPSNILGQVVSDLENHGLLVATESEHLIPGRDTDCIKLNDILQAIRYRTGPRDRRSFVSTRSVDTVASEVEAAIAEKLQNKTLRDLLE